jgi:hypothetical protein
MSPSPDGYQTQRNAIEAFCRSLMTEGVIDQYRALDEIE